MLCVMESVCQSICFLFAAIVQHAKSSVEREKSEPDKMWYRADDAIQIYTALYILSLSNEGSGKYAFVSAYQNERVIKLIML